MNLMKNIIKSALLLGFSGLLVACGSDSKTEADSNTGTPNEVVLAPQPPLSVPRPMCLRSLN